MFSERTGSRLEDIVNDAARVKAFMAGMDLDAFGRDERTMLAVERLMQRVTEAVIQIGVEELARIAPAIPATKIRDFGNLLRHQYADIDVGVVFTIAREDLPVLAGAAARALAEQ